MGDQQHETEPREGAMDRSGMGPLPGMALAMVIGIVIIGGALINEWWVVPVIFVVLIALAIAVVVVLIAMMQEEGEGRLRRYIPGL